MAKKLFLGFGTLLIVGFLVVGALIYTNVIPLPFFMTATSPKNPVTTETLENINAAHVNRDYDAAIAQLEPIASDESDPIQAAQAKHKLAINLLNRGFDQSEMNDDVARGMELLQTVAVDASLPGKVRALALSDLATTLNLHNAAFYTTYVTRTPFTTYLLDPEDAFGVAKACAKMYEYANMLHPNAYSQYSIVKMYTTLLSNNVFIGDMTSTSTAELIQTNIESADRLRSLENFTPATEARMMLDRAMGFALAANILGNKTAEEREEAFKEALTTAQQSSDTNKYSKDVEMDARFWYSSFLANVYGSEREAQIRELTAPFKPGVTAAEDFLVTRRVFVTINVPPYTNFRQKRALVIASFSPDFKDFLTSVGWQL